MVYRIDDVTAVSSPPPVPSDNIGQPGFFTGGSTSGQSATRVRFWWLNMVQEELVAFAKAAGLGLDKANNGQALAGARILFAAAERGIAPYSAALAGLIGGYPKYAIVVDAAGVLWRSSADANMTVPGADGAKWGLLFDGLATQEWADDRYQESLNFTPVQQGGGSGQGPNKVILGWAADGSGLKCQVDGTDEGFFLFRGETQCFAFSSMSYNTSTVLASLTFLPKYNGYLKLDYNLGQDSSNPVQNISVAGSGFSLIGSCDNNSGTNLRVGSALYGVTAGEQVVINMTGSYTASSGHTALGGTAIYVPR
ncbi:MAG: hypothetical protein ABF553_04940 [Acetobacter orientalis]|uniref:hypothetical protein n=1 Tax=Acetobacter orientalis TaxID=146474 RepID=UPI0039EB9ACD